MSTSKQENLSPNPQNLSPKPQNAVFIPNKGTHDYSDALRYGQLVFVTLGEQSKFAVGKMARRWADVIANSTPNDYILITSLTTLCSIGCALFALKHGGKLNLLMFRENRYIERKMDLAQALENLDLGEVGL